MKSRKEHWEQVYSTKQPHEVSWTQDRPNLSLDFIHSFNISRRASIIDVGGGDSRLVDFLLDEGYENITVLDISERALERARARLGSRAQNVRWITSDILDFEPTQTYDCWHDRATFHFLKSSEERTKYVAHANASGASFLAIATFSETGPQKCSGLEVQQYSEDDLVMQFASGFRRLKCISEMHTTPFGTQQNFTFCAFERLK